ncbi:hypothetical protein JW964_23535 [candidate division KSB1 bacterium]|nr:hypothetical protein [candidate division KSB1 bacterium]
MLSIRIKKQFLRFFNSLILSTFCFTFINAAPLVKSSIPESTLVHALSSPDSIKLLKVKSAIANTIIEAKANLGIWGVLVGLNPDSTPPENIFQRKYFTSNLQPFNLKGLVNFNESLIITLIEFKQKSMPQNTKPSEYNLKDNVLKPVGSFFGRLLSKKHSDDSELKTDDPSADNIQTKLHIYVQAVDNQNERQFGNFSINIVHTGGDKFISFESALEKLADKATIELKILFLLSSEVTFESKNSGKISLTGKYIEPGMLFELIEPDRIQQVGDETLVTPGKRAGIATVVDTLTTNSLIKLVRTWRPGSPGFWAVEYPNPIFALQVNYHPPSNYAYQRLDFQFNFTPLKRFDSGGGFHLFKIRDNQDDDVGGFGFFGFLLWRMYYSDRFTFGTKFSFDMDIPIRNDDDGNSVSLILPSISTGLNTEFLISEKVDLVLEIGYRLSSSASGWRYTTEEEESVSAYWADYSYPRVKNTGMLISLGFRYLIF